MLVALALSTALFFIGSVFFYWGAWNYVLGSKYGLFFGNQIAWFGGFLVYLGIVVAKRMFRERMRIGTAMIVGLILIYLSLFFFYFGLHAILFPRFLGQVYSGVAGIRVGSTYAILGVILILLVFISRKTKWLNLDQ